MKRIIRGRGHGKTYDLIKYAIENDCAIVCASYGQKKYIENMAKKHFNKEIRTYTLEEWRKDGRHSKNNKCVVDEMELIMRWVLGGELVGWNMSIE